MRKVLLGLLIPVILGTRISLIILDKRSRWWPDSTAINTLAWGYVNLGFTVSFPPVHAKQTFGCLLVDADLCG
jgi:hypothetical protein